MSTTSSPDFPTADFGSRFSAFVIDATLLFVGQWVGVTVLARQLQAVGLSSRQNCGADGAAQLCEGPSGALWALIVVILLATTVGYYAFFEGRYGATPGKRWMGLSVVSLAGQNPLGFGVASLRSIVRQAFWLSLFFVFDASPLGLSLPPLLFVVLPAACFALVGYGAIAADGRGVHDLVAGTQVVRSDQVPAAFLSSQRSAMHQDPEHSQDLHDDLEHDDLEHDDLDDNDLDHNSEESV